MSAIDPNKSVVWFDLDETLMQVTLTKNHSPEDSLSESAIPNLSESDTGSIEKPILLKNALKEIAAEKVNAFWRLGFKDIFERISKVNEGKKEPIIEVNIITNASYTKDQVIDVLKKFFGNDNVNINHFVNKDRGCSKGKYIRSYYKKHHKNEIPKEHIFLVDDSEDNCKSVERRGFKAIRMNTRIDTREEGATFSEAKENIRETFDEIIKRAQ